MESYRDALYRYSTGQGFNFNVNIPEIACDVSAFKAEPLVFNNIAGEIVVDVKREADRASMEAEDGMQQLKVLGYDSMLSKKTGYLKKRVDLMRDLLTKYYIRYILRSDLNTLYDLYATNSPGFDVLIAKVIYYNSHPSILDKFAPSAGRRSNMYKVQGYLPLDRFGRELSPDDKITYDQSKSDLSGLGDSSLIDQLKTGDLLPDQIFGWSIKTILIGLILVIFLRK